MTAWRNLGWIILVFLAGNAAGLDTARMALPEEFAQRATRITLEGFGGRNKGSYTMGDYRGSFTRKESRLGIFDPLYASSKGKSSFSFQEKGSPAPLEAVCWMEKGTVTVGIVTFDPKKMIYRCEFRRDQKLEAASFVMGQPRAENMKQRFLARSLRSGESNLNNHHLRFDSVHAYKGTALTSQVPVGYLIRLQDTVVGAVELTDWNPTFYLDSKLDEEVHQSVLITALAIAVLRDPADSALEE